MCFYKFIYFIYLFSAVLSLRSYARASSSCSERGLLFVGVRGLLTAVASLVVEHGLQARGYQQLWLAGSRAQAQQLWRMGLVAPQHVGSPQTRDQTRVPCISRCILNHCATREVLFHNILKHTKNSIPKVGYRHKIFSIMVKDK